MAKFLPVYDENGRLASLIPVADIRHVSVGSSPNTCDLLLGAVGTFLPNCHRVVYTADIDVVFALINI